MVRQFIFHELNQVTDFLKSLSMDYVAVHLADSTGVVGYIQQYYIGSDNILQRAASVGMVWYVLLEGEKAVLYGYKSTNFSKMDLGYLIDNYISNMAVYAGVELTYPYMAPQIDKLNDYTMRIADTGRLTTAFGLTVSKYLIQKTQIGGYLNQGVNMISSPIKSLFR
jgi:hypothetical protein